MRQLAPIGMAISLLVTACGEDSVAAEPGFETGPCLAGECLGGLACEAGQCVVPHVGGTADDGDSGTGASPGAGTTGTNGDDTTSGVGNDSSTGSGSDDPTSAVDDGRTTTSGPMTTNDPVTTNDTSSTGVGEPLLPDLYAGYFYVDDHSMAPGQSSSMHFEVANAGEAENLFQFNLVVVLTQNQTIGDADDIPLYGWLYPYSVPVMDGSLWQGPFEIPATAYDGEYYVGIYLDTTDIIVESDETNNFLFDPDTMVITGNPAPEYRDLTPSNVAASSSQVFAGHTIDLAFDIENLEVDDVASYSVGLYFSSDPDITTGDIPLCTYADDDGIAGMATESHVTSCTVPALDGDYFFGVVVDPSDAISETDETNNTGSDPLIVTVTPLDVDLSPSAVTSSSYVVETDDVVDLGATITNSASTPSPVFDVSFYISADANIDTSDELVCTTQVAAGLAPGGNADAAAACAVPLVPTGTYWLGAVADPADQIGESSEANNAATAASPIDITAPDVDLAYYLHWHDAVALSPGQLVSYHLQVQNDGTAASPGFEASIHYSSDMNVTSADPSACTVALGSVPALTLTEFTFDCPVPNVAAGWYFSGAIVDPANEVPETDETNNVGADAFTELIQ